MSRPGIIAASKPQIIIPSYVTPSQVGQSNGGNTTVSNSKVITLPTVSGGILANDLILIWATNNKGSVATMNPLISGYTTLYSLQVTRGLIVNSGACFAKIASGGDANPTMTTDTTTSTTWVSRVYRGAVGLPSAITPISQANFSGTPVANTVDPDRIEDLILTGAHVRTGSTGEANLVWGGGAADSYMTLSGRNAGLYLGSQVGTDAPTTHNATVSSSDGGASIVMGSIVLPAKAA